MTTATDRQALIGEWLDKASSCKASADNADPATPDHGFYRGKAAGFIACAQMLEALSSSASSEAPPVSEDVEKCWQEFWAPIVAPNGVLNLNQVKLELSDFSDVMREVSIAYDDVTGGHISKPNTLARHVIERVNERIEEACDEAVKEAREEWEMASQQPEKTADDAPDDVVTYDQRESWALGFNAAMGEVYGSSVPVERPQVCVIGRYCRRHGFIHGGEAEELRSKVEKILGRVRGEDRLSRAIRDMLDEVDARDSLALLEAPAKTQEERPDYRLARVRQILMMDQQTYDVPGFGGGWYLISRVKMALLKELTQSSPVPNEAKKDGER